MSQATVFLRKDKENYKWSYLIDMTHYSVYSTGNMLEQLVDVITVIRDTHDFHGSEITICSTAFMRALFEDLKLIFPHMNLIAITDNDLSKLFTKIMSNAATSTYRKRNRRLFVCSDASKSPSVDLCGWAWFSSDNSGAQNYNFGVGKENSTVTAEFEGILHAIIDNADKGYNTIHVYCDSMQSVECAQKAILSLKRVMPLFAKTNKRLAKLIEEAYFVSLTTNIRIEWVRGHKSHRLNMGADYLSRRARVTSERRGRLTTDDVEVNAVMRLFA